jgi:Ca-activated chloride channel family protein
MSEFQFGHPYFLLLLLLLPLLAFLRGRRGRDAALQYSGLSLFGPLARARRITPGGWLSALRYLALFCFIVALARPQRVDTNEQVSQSGIDMMLAIDL